MKICSTCKKEKDYSEFFKNSNQGDGYGVRCRGCCREYRLKSYPENKDKIRAQISKWKEENPDKVNAYNYGRKYDGRYKESQKRFVESKRDGYYYVYLLTKENYVGMTANLYFRMNHHKCAHSRDVSEVKILGRFKDKSQALQLEKEYHSKGYAGANPIHFTIPETFFTGKDI